MEYVKSFLYAAALVCVASALAPTKESVRRAVLSALSLVLLLFLIPKNADLSLGDLFPALDGGSVTESAPVLEDAWEESVERGIRDDLCQKYNLAPTGVAVSCRLSKENDTVAISYLSLTLSGKNALADATGMLTYIEKNYGVHAEIHVKS